MNLNLWTIAKEIPSGLPVNITSNPAQHDGSYYWIVSAKDTAPTQVEGESVDEITLNLLKVLSLDGSVTVTKQQAKAIYAHSAHRCWVGKYDVQASYEADYPIMRDLINAQAATKIPDSVRLPISSLRGLMKTSLLSIT